MCPWQSYVATECKGCLILLCILRRSFSERVVTGMGHTDLCGGAPRYCSGGCSGDKDCSALLCSALVVVLIVVAVFVVDDVGVTLVLVMLRCWCHAIATAAAAASAVVVLLQEKNCRCCCCCGRCC